MSKTYLIACLGNPGESYAYTRHNIGFRVGEQLVSDLHLDKVGQKFKSIMYKGRMENGDTVIVLFPQTYMNISGQAVQAAVAFFKIPMDHMIVVYDDYDIDFGKGRLRPKGSGGSHNGIKSIIQCLGSQDFPRYRVGIGPKPSEWQTNDFVLSSFTKKEETDIPNILQSAATYIQTWMVSGIDAAMREISKKKANETPNTQHKVPEQNQKSKD